MRKTMRAGAAGLAMIAAAVTGACSDEATGPDFREPTALLSVQPAGGTVGVEVGTDVVVRFDHAIAEGMERYASLHEGSVVGPEVPGAWTRSADGATLTFSPAAPLKPATTYVIHLGGGMMDEDGEGVDLGMHGLDMGGQWATGSMMTGGMGSGMTGSATHMGAGWQHPSNGSYGMVFAFTTADG